MGYLPWLATLILRAWHKRIEYELVVIVAQEWSTKRHLENLPAWKSDEALETIPGARPFKSLSVSE